MPTFEDLPRELRQAILKIAFTETVAADLEFSLNIRKYICDDNYKSKLRRFYLPKSLSSALRFALFHIRVSTNGLCPLDRYYCYDPPRSVS